MSMAGAQKGGGRAGDSVSPVSSANEIKEVLLFSTADWDTPYWTNKQHSAVHLAKFGYRVLYVETVGIRPPTFRSSRDLGRICRRIWQSIRGPRKVKNGIWVLSPLTIPFGHRWKVVALINRWLLAGYLRLGCIVARIKSPLVWTYHPYMLGAIRNIQYSKILYHCVDDLSAIPGVDIKAYRIAEQGLLKKADIVFTTSIALKKACEVLNKNVHFLPNVVDFDHFSSAFKSLDVPEEFKAIPEPRIGYIGVLSDFKVNFSLIKQLVIARPDWSWVFIGEEREGQSIELVAELKQFPNTYFLGYRAYSDLPAYMKGLSVGTLPSLINEYTRSMFPMKYFEYLAAGLRVVSTPLDFTKEYTAGMSVGENFSEFLAAIEEQLAKGRLCEAAAEQAVSSNTWDKRLTKMLSLIN